MFFWFVLATFYCSLFGMDHQKLQRAVQSVQKGGKKNLEKRYTTMLSETRRSLEDAFCAATKPKMDAYLNSALASAQRALEIDGTKDQSELQTVISFVRAHQGLSGGDSDTVLSHLVEVIRGPFSNTLLRNVRNEAFGLVRVLADTKNHALSQFYLTKHLLNSADSRMVADGLRRFESLFNTNAHEKKFREMSELFHHSDILTDIKLLAEKDNAYAHYILAKYHLFLAQYGTEMDGSPVEPRHALAKALACASRAQQIGFRESDQLVVAIQKELSAYEQAASALVVSVSAGQKLAENGESFNDGVFDVDCSRESIPSLKEFCAASVATYGSSLYTQGKQLVASEKNGHYAEGIACLEKSVAHGNAFAAELLGDLLYESDPTLAFAYYMKALHSMRSAPKNSYWGTICCFKSAHIEKKCELLAQTDVLVSRYFDALLSGKNLMFDRARCLDGVLDADVRQQILQKIAAHEKKSSAFVHLVRTVHDVENGCAKDKERVDARFLELIRTTGVLSILDVLKSHQVVQDLLINVLSLRARVGRGYVLKEETRLAHAKKALQLILKSDTAVAESIESVVTLKELLKPVVTSELSAQHRILYRECLLIVVEELLKTPVIDKENAQDICSLFALVNTALHATDDAPFKQLHEDRLFKLMGPIGALAIRYAVADCIFIVGTYYRSRHMQDEAYAYMSSAEQLYSTALEKIESAKKNADVSMRLACIKLVCAQWLHAHEHIDEAYKKYKEAIALQPKDVELRWQFAHFLMESGNAQMRQEGLPLVSDLAQKHKHRLALAFMADCYCGTKPHIMQSDTVKAIETLKQLVQMDSKNEHDNRTRLANCYMSMERQASGIARKQFLAKAHDIVKPYRRCTVTLHRLYAHILVAMTRECELMQELDATDFVFTVSIQDQLKIVNTYSSLADTTVQSKQLARKLLEKSKRIIEKSKDQSEEAYIIWLQLLLKVEDYQRFAIEVQTPKSADIVCIQQALQAKALLAQKGIGGLDQVVQHIDKAIDAYMQSDVNMHKRVEALLQLLAPDAPSEVYDPEVISGVLIPLLNQSVEIINDGISQVPCCAPRCLNLHATAACLGLRLSLLAFMRQKITITTLFEICAMAIATTQRCGDALAKQKLYTIMKGQLQQWRENMYGCFTLDTAIMITRWIVFCVNVIKEDAQMSKDLYAIVQAYEQLFTSRIEALTGADQSALCLQKEILTRVTSKLSPVILENSIRDSYVHF